jgi:hypothetical protein
LIHEKGKTIPDAVRHVFIFASFFSGGEKKAQRERWSVEVYFCLGQDETIKTRKYQKLNLFP